MSRLSNRRIVLAARPKGAPTVENFRLERVAVPELEGAQVLLHTIYLSLDPYMRGRMNDGPSYAAPAAVDGVMPGATVSRVIESKNPGFQVGDLVLAYVGWQEYAVSDGKGLTKLGPEFPKPSYALGVLGMPGFTAYMGLLDIGNPQPGETVVVAAATGAVGAVVGQIAKIKGARAVGIAGGAEKCAYAVSEFGFDACLDHHDPALAKNLAEAAPKGIDVYFENVGGKVLDAVWPRLNTFARVPLCGMIARYNEAKLPEGPDRSPLMMLAMLAKRIRMQGFIVGDYNARMPEFLRDMPSWLREGRVKTREDIVEGIENTPTAFLGMLEGKNFGKLIVQVAAL
jgi:NADPH-dependent curcumin reductase CurA